MSAASLVEAVIIRILLTFMIRYYRLFSVLED